MAQQPQAWRSGSGEKRWLSMLVDTMEELSRPEIRTLPCQQSLLVAVEAQLARPASAYVHVQTLSRFSLRN
jgi:hypothetical protein